MGILFWKMVKFFLLFCRNNAVFIFKDKMWNGLQIDGKNDDVMTVKPVDEKFAAFGWNVIVIDGHNFDEIFDAFDKARACKGKPTIIIAKTHKGQGVSFMTDNAGWHGKAPSDEEAKQAVEELGGEW